MADDGWIWGSKRGGGGAPLKDSSGAVITNLRLHAKQAEQNPQPMQQSHPPQNSYHNPQMRPPSLDVNNQMDYNNQFQQPYYQQQQQQQMYSLQMPQQQMYQQPPQLGSPSAQNYNNNNNNNDMSSPAPMKFMSALRDMNANPGERDEKIR